jgi:large subunit ribosomal protein L25
MSVVTAFNAEKREVKGKGAARALRRQEKVPGIIYGGGEQELPVAIERRALVKELNKGGFYSKLIELDVDGGKVRVLPRDIQTHPVTDIPEHIDFLRIKDGEKVAVEVRVLFINEHKAPGIKRGGVLNVVRHKVELLCDPDKIPASITADIDGLSIGDSVHASSITLPDGVEYTITDRDFTVATIAGRMKKEEVVEATAEGAEELSAEVPSEHGSVDADKPQEGGE